MEKQDFIALADVLKARKRSIEEYYKQSPLYQSNALTVWEKIEQDLADFCQARNPAFNRRRWLNYIAGKCGPGGGPTKGS